MILGKLGGSGWASSNHDLSMDKAVTSKVVGPNLTACHPSFGSPDLIVYCCPPGFESPVLFVDFQFPLTVKVFRFKNHWRERKRRGRSHSCARNRSERGRIC